jgi:hypothetical protein
VGGAITQLLVSNTLIDVKKDSAAASRSVWDVNLVTDKAFSRSIALLPSVADTFGVMSSAPVNIITDMITINTLVASASTAQESKSKSVAFSTDVSTHLSVLRNKLRSISFPYNLYTVVNTTDSHYVLCEVGLGKGLDILSMTLYDSYLDTVQSDTNKRITSCILACLEYSRARVTNNEVTSLPVPSSPRPLFRSQLVQTDLESCGPLALLLARLRSAGVCPAKAVVMDTEMVGRVRAHFQHELQSGAMGM